MKRTRLKLLVESSSNTSQMPTRFKPYIRCFNDVWELVIMGLEFVATGHRLRKEAWP